MNYHSICNADLTNGIDMASYHVNNLTTYPMQYQISGDYELKLDKKYVEEIINAINNKKDCLNNIEDIEIPPLRGFIEI